jgi:hypothetical protein
MMLADRAYIIKNEQRTAQELHDQPDVLQRHLGV